MTNLQKIELALKDMKLSHAKLIVALKPFPQGCGSKVKEYPQVAIATAESICNTVKIAGEKSA